MSGPWWPEGAPVAAQRLGELTSRELGILTRFAENIPATGTDAARLAEFTGRLRDEAADRAEVIARFTANAKAGRFGPL